MKNCPRFNNLYGMRKVLAGDLDGKRGIRSQNQDRVVVISGYEGKGKSNLLLDIFDIWYNELLKVPDYGESYIKYLGANKSEFVHALAKGPKYHMIAHDEALKDLYSRDAISTFNKSLNKAFFVIRGRNLFTILACPSILDLDANFRRRRVTYMLHVYSKGKFAFYGRDKLNKLIPAMMKMQLTSARPDPKWAKDERYKHITPDFTDTFKLYKGPLLAAYTARKDSNMAGIVDELVNEFGSDEAAQGTNHGNASKRHVAYKEKMVEMYKLGANKNEIRDKLHIGYKQMNKMFSELIDEGKISID